MDEPAAGLNPSGVDALNDLITRIRSQGVVVLLVEHVMGISDEIPVLYHGEMLAEGTPAAIQANPTVIKAYLGEPEAHEVRAAGHGALSDGGQCWKCAICGCARGHRGGARDRSQRPPG